MKHEIVQSHSTPVQGEIVNGILTTMLIHDEPEQYDRWRIKCTCGHGFQITTRDEALRLFDQHCCFLFPYWLLTVHQNTGHKVYTLRRIELQVQ